MPQKSHSASSFYQKNIHFHVLDLPNFHFIEKEKTLENPTLKIAMEIKHASCGCTKNVDVYDDIDV